MKARRMLSVILAGVMLLTAVPAAVFAEAVPETEADTGVSITKQVFPCYLQDIDTFFDLPVYFVNEVTDLPYIDMMDWADVMVTLCHSLGYGDYELYVERDGHVAQYTRENDYTMLVDFEAGTIAFDDYDAFTRIGRDRALLDMVSMDYYNEEGKQIVMERIARGSFDRYGREIELSLGDYDISVYWSEEDSLYLLPLQTLGDFLTACPLGINVYFNEEAVYLSTADNFGVYDELTPLGESYYSAPYADMSETLAWFNYCELCLAMDHLYGLKEIHDISSFDRVFRETGYVSDLSSTDPNVAEGALFDFIYYFLDDLHSNFEIASYRTEKLQTIGGTGLSSMQDSVNKEIFEEAREAAPEEILPYQEVGNTAYVTFDSFVYRKDLSEYYTEGVDMEGETDPSSDSMETIGLILYAHEKICREDSPIENVVVDLSLNGGGALDACAFVAAWMLGEASLSIRSSLTGAISTGMYRVDANLDGEFDEKDTVADKNLYCLIGPYSFSCGNLLPNILKSSNKVTLLGQTSGGGSCVVLNMSSASGAYFKLSSPYRMSFLKNGSYYDIDLGVEPDCYITKPANFYNREALTEYINQLF